MEHQLPENYCPYCGKCGNMAANATNQQRRPRPGDITICIACGEVLEFDSMLGLCKLPLGKLEELRIHQQDIWKVIQMTKAVLQKNKACLDVQTRNE